MWRGGETLKGKELKQTVCVLWNRALEEGDCVQGESGRGGLEVPGEVRAVLSGINCV